MYAIKRDALHKTIEVTVTRREGDEPHEPFSILYDKKRKRHSDVTRVSGQIRLVHYRLYACLPKRD